MNEDRAERRSDEARVAEFDDVPVFIDRRLQPYFDSKPMNLTTGGFGPLKDVKLVSDAAFAEFVSRLMEQIWDSHYQRH